jgi:hypothetical protein
LSTPERHSEGEPQMWSTLLHAGLARSFLRLPHLPPSSKELASRGVGAAIYGLPWDSTVISRSGTNYGPCGSGPGRSPSSRGRVYEQKDVKS